MASYVVLARKWRPAQFSDIVGQTHIVKTLTNAIREQRVHQAYLFTGSRGIGKTSIARIFAKALRCDQVQLQTGELRSCDVCASCREITAGNSVDVMEIDGASNNGVESVREIRENAKYMPSTGTRKIYIIDEVHMLTTAAFNALLKTLEEPPSHVIFIFATTEPHKIPVTILSRCQRFDYRKVTSSQIQTRLEEVAKSEGIDAETGSFALMARAAEGSMRDALSILDQVIAFSGNRISVQSTRESIGLVDGQAVLDILSHVFQKKPKEALQVVHQAYQQGHDLRVFTRSLIEFLHGAILVKIGATESTSLNLSAEEQTELQNLVQYRSLEEMELIFQVLHHGLEWIARSPQPKLVLDVLLIKCATAEALVSLNTIPASASPSPQKEVPAQAQPLPAQSVQAQVTQPVPPPTPESPVIETQKAPTPPGEKSWVGFIQHIRRSRPLLASILEHSNDNRLPQSNTEHYLSIFFAPTDAYFKEQLQSRSYQEQLIHFAREYFGNSVRLQVELKEAGESLAARKEREERERIQSAKDTAQSHPIILEARSLFGGELGPIEIKEPRHAEL